MATKARKMIATAALGLVIAGAVPAQASSGAASCIGQALSTFGPAYGAALGAQIAYEAHNAGTIFGTRNLGAAVGAIAQADRAACPEE
ncbi:MAG: hypothetical protein WD096_08705 [Actinomycetota bacterium]